MTTPLLSVENLTVTYRGSGGDVAAVRDASFEVGAGEIVAIVGESGSGKSTIAQTILGLLAHRGRIDAGAVRLDGVDLTRLGPRAMRRIRGREIGLVPQDPGVSLNPVHRVGDQVGEVLRLHKGMSRARAGAAAVDLLAKAGLSEPARRARQFPHELSGGMRQRALIAAAIAAEPRLVVADEPTSALDVTVQKLILDELELLTSELGSSLLLITHDLAVAADRADRIIVMTHGQIVESGTVDEVFGNPRHDYTRRLLASAPALRAETLPTGPTTPAPLVEIVGLTKVFGSGRAGVAPTPRAVDEVSFSIPRGQTLGLVGESGSGKSTTARLILHLDRPTSGTMRFDGVDVTDLSSAALRSFRRRAQLIYQNPFASLEPRWTIGQIIGEPLRAFRIADRAERRSRAAELLDRVALRADMIDRRPAELSGGQRQRVAIARALALEPDLVVCDEPVSALDVSVQAQILDLLRELQRDLGLTYLFISHDLAVVREVAHNVGVMKQGELIEYSTTAEVFEKPKAEYTRLLLDSIPGVRETRTGSRTPLEGRT